MAESVDALDLGSSALKHAGSSPAIRNDHNRQTKNNIIKIFKISGMKGIEPLLLVLETNVLPLNYTPLLRRAEPIQEVIPIFLVKSK
jgi:hypothetical protein